MANEITVVGESKRDQSRLVRLLFLYPIESPHQVGAQNVVPTPSSGLPSVGGSTFVSQAEADALDAGAMAFEVVTYAVRPSDERDGKLTNAQHLARAREIYAAKKAEWLAGYDNTYGGRIGARFDAAV